MGDFLCVGLLAECLLIRLRGVVVREYETIFNFITTNEITAFSGVERQFSSCICQDLQMFCYLFCKRQTRTQ